MENRSLGDLPLLIVQKDFWVCPIVDEEKQKLSVCKWTKRTYPIYGSLPCMFMIDVAGESVIASLRCIVPLLSAFMIGNVKFGRSLAICCPHSCRKWQN